LLVFIYVWYSVRSSIGNLQLLLPFAQNTHSSGLTQNSFMSASTEEKKDSIRRQRFSKHSATTKGQ